MTACLKKSVKSRERLLKNGNEPGACDEEIASGEKLKGELKRGKG